MSRTSSLAASRRPNCCTVDVVGALLAADVQTAGVAAGIVKQHDVTGLDVAVERERQIHHRVLQALAHPHRHDLHRRRIAVQAPVAFGCAASLFALGSQPVTQGGQAEVLAVRGVVQHLRQVRHVGHMAFAVEPRQHPRSHAPELRGLEDGRDATFAGVIGPLTQGVGDPIGQRVTLGGKGFGGLAEEHGRRRRPHQPGAVRLIECLQQAQPVVGRRRAEDVGVAGVHRGDARGGQRVEAHAAVSVRLDDHRDVTRPQRPVAEGRAAREQRGDVGGQIRADVGAQPVHRDDAIGLGAQRISRHHPQPERLVVWGALEPVLLMVGRHLPHDDPGVTELGVAHHRLKAVDERGRRCASWCRGSDARLRCRRRADT